MEAVASNQSLSDHFMNLARELEVLEPKTPEDIYKMHLEPRAVSIESWRSNLASSFVNGFLNAGFKSDKLMLAEGTKWLTKNKDFGQLAATASVGLLYLWDVDGGVGTIMDKFMDLPHDHAKAGALLAIGIACTGVRNEADPALALLTEYVDARNTVLRTAAILGLGLAYSGTRNTTVADLLVPLLVDTTLAIEVRLLDFWCLFVGFMTLFVPFGMFLCLSVHFLCIFPSSIFYLPFVSDFGSCWTCSWPCLCFFLRQRACRALPSDDA